MENKKEEQPSSDDSSCCTSGCECGTRSGASTLIVAIVFLLGGVIGYLIDNCQQGKCWKKMGGMGCPMMTQMHQPEQKLPK